MSTNKINILLSDSLRKHNEDIEDNILDTFGHWNMKNDYVICNIDDIQKEKTYYVCYRTYGYPSHDLENKEFEIPSDIINLYKEGYDIKFLLVTFHESDSPLAIINIKKYANSIGIDEKQFYLFCGNDLIDNLKQQQNSNINVYSNNHIPVGIARVFEHAGSWGYDTERDCLFQCYNRAFKSHRVAIVLFLKKENLLDKVDYSFLQGYRLKDYYNVEDDCIDYFKSSDTPIIDETENEVYDKEAEWLYAITSKKSKFENFEFDKNGPQHDLTYKNNLYKHAYINIVTETQYEWKDVIHITEKSTQPLWFYQIPIILATHGHIKRMREKFEFDWFDDVVDHSYDLEENPSKRFKMIQSEIIRLSKIENEIKDFFKHNFKRFEHNRNVIKKLINDDSDKNFIKSLAI